MHFAVGFGVSHELSSFVYPQNVAVWLAEFFVSSMLLLDVCIVWCWLARCKCQDDSSGGTQTRPTAE